MCSCACNIIPDHHSVQHPCVAATNDVVVKQHFQTPRIRHCNFRPHFCCWGCVQQDTGLKRYLYLDGFWPKTRMKMVSSVLSSPLPQWHNQDPPLMSVCREEMNSLAVNEFGRESSSIYNHAQTLTEVLATLVSRFIVSRQTCLKPNCTLSQ